MGRTTADEKYQAKQQRRRGLQKTRFYCQVCERQCLDENGFKCHVQSEVHMKNLQSQLESHGGSSRSIVNEYSDQFVNDFISLLKKSHGIKMIGANRFYQEYIKNKDHVHLNSTRWRALTKAVLFMKEKKVLKVVDANGINDEQYYIGYIDNSPEAIKRRQREEMKEFENGDEDVLQLDQGLQEQMMRAEALKRKLEEKSNTKSHNVENSTDQGSKVSATKKLLHKKKLSFGLKSKVTKNKEGPKIGLQSSRK